MNAQNDGFFDYLQTLSFPNNDFSYLRSSTRIQPQVQAGGRKQEQLREDKSTVKLPNKLEELMTCFICLSKLQNPHICPCCSKLCCHSCITKWLTENKQVCPHCRSVLRVHMLVNCRFLEDLGSALQSPPPQDPCSNHPTSSLQYYCITCSEPVCSECAMFSTHKQHDFEHIQKVFDQRVREVNKEVEEINSSLRGLKDNVRQVDELVDRLNRGKDDKVQEIQQYSEQLLQKLEQSHQQRLMVLFQQKQTLSSKIHSIHTTKEEVTQQIQNCQKSELISQSEQLVKRVKSLKDEHFIQPNLECVNLEFQSEITPDYIASVFELKQFSMYESNAIVYSPPLLHNYIKWRLKVYPNGNGNAKDHYISVFLEMGQNTTVAGAKRYEYKVEMINARMPASCVVREFASEFEGGECWGYNRFYRIDLLKKEGYLSEDDGILFKFYVRAPTYFSECLDMRRYIQHLEDRNPQPSEQKPFNQTTQKDDESYQSVQEVSEQKPFGQSEAKQERSSILKLKQEIEHYAEKIEELEQQSDSSNHIRLESQTSSECYDFEPEDLDFQQKLLELAKNPDQPVRRNLIRKFELEAKGSQENLKFCEPKQQGSASSYSSTSAYDTKEFLDKLDQFKQYSNIVQKVVRRTNVLSEVNQSQ